MSPSWAFTNTGQKQEQIWFVDRELVTQYMTKLSWIGWVLLDQSGFETNSVNKNPLFIDLVVSVLVECVVCAVVRQEGAL